MHGQHPVAPVNQGKDQAGGEKGQGHRPPRQGAEHGEDVVVGGDLLGQRAGCLIVAVEVVVPEAPLVLEIFLGPIWFSK